MGLEDLSGLEFDAPITGELIETINEIVDEAGAGPRDLEAVLMRVVVAVGRIEVGMIGVQADLRKTNAELLELKAYALNLEARVLEAGLPLGRE